MRKAHGAAVYAAAVGLIGMMGALAFGCTAPVEEEVEEAQQALCIPSCATGFTCVGTVCKKPCGSGGCPRNTTCCTGTGYCEDLDADENNCGSCGLHCIGTTCCGGGCVDTNTNNLNCGTCGHQCLLAQCVNGVCVGD